MKKFLIQIILLIIVILSMLYATTNPEVVSKIFKGNWTVVDGSNPVNESKKLKINDTLITVEIADTQQKRSKGLSGRDSLPENYGVLFVFDTSKRYQFWMKGMKFPIDMIFINDGKIVDILEDVPNPSPDTPDNLLPIYQSTEDVNMVLEVNSGFVKQNSVKLGDRIVLVKN